MEGQDALLDVVGEGANGSGEAPAQDVQAPAQDVQVPADLEERHINNLPDRRSSFFIDEQHELPIIIIGPDNEEIRPVDIIVPPDGGWGWAIVFAAFMSNVVADGCIYTSGVILLSDKANVSKADVSWMVGILLGCNLLSGPFVSLLANVLGFRITAIVGFFLSGFGYIFAWFFCRDGVPNIPALFVLFGFVAGTGFGFIYVPAVIAVGFYFQKRRALATGIAVCGSGVGTFIFPPITGLLIATLDWQKALLIQGILLALSSCLGCLYAPLKPPAQKTVVTSDGRRLSSQGSLLTADSIGQILRARLTGLSHSSFARPTEEQTENLNNEDPDFLSSTPQVRNEPVLTEIVEKRNGRMTATESMESTAPEVHKHTRKASSPSMLLSMARFNLFSRQNSFDSDGSGRDAHKEQPVHEIGGPDSGETITRSLSITSGNRKSLRLKSIALMNEDGVDEVSTVTLLLPDSEEDITQSRVYRVADIDTLNSPLNMSSIFYPGSLSNIPELVENEEGFTWEATPVILDEFAVRPKRKWHCKLLRKMLDFSLLKSWTFLLLAISGAINTLGFFIPFIYLTELVAEICDSNGAALNTTSVNGTAFNSTSLHDCSGTQNQKFPTDDANLLISIIGVTNTLGRIIFGAISDKMGAHILKVNNAALTIGGLVTVAVPFFEDYALLALYSGLFGASVAAHVLLRSIILVQLLGLSKLTNAFGLLLLFQGTSAMVGSPVAGYLRDATRSYAVSFYVAGSMIALSGVLCYPVQWVHNWEVKRNSANSAPKI